VDTSRLRAFSSFSLWITVWMVSPTSSLKRFSRFTSLSINEISQMCGYPSLQYFYSVFKKEYDVTPKD
jgi:AraC-like DNA-binding protein